MSATPSIDTSDSTTQALLERGVDTLYPGRQQLAAKLRSGERLKVYLGVDPSGADLHIGHMVALQKLAQFQRAGHQVILLIGNFTGQTGDPTDKQAVRVPLTKEQVEANAAKYQAQASSVLRFDGTNPAAIRYNADWLGTLTFTEVAELAGHFTVQQMLERDMFENRLKEGKPISLREFLYPLMQGYDSVALGVDIEIGGSDQTFNMLAGRKLLREYADKEKFVMTVPLLADSNGVKIGKSEGNAIAVSGTPEDLYGQSMGLPDEVVATAIKWCTSVPSEEVAAVAALVTTDPMAAKKRLAYALVKEFQGASAAAKGQQHFEQVFQKGELPAEIPEWRPSQKVMNSRTALKEAGLAASTSEAQRLLQEGAVRVNGEVYKTVGDWQPVAGTIIQVGKKKFRRVSQ